MNLSQRYTSATYCIYTTAGTADNRNRQQRAVDNISTHRIPLTLLRALSTALPSVALLTLPATPLALSPDETDDADRTGVDTAGVRGVRAVDDVSGVVGRSRLGKRAFFARRRTAGPLPSAAALGVAVGGRGDSSRMSRCCFAVAASTVWSVREERVWASWMLGSIFSCPTCEADSGPIEKDEAVEGADGEKGSDECSRLGVRDISAAAGEAVSPAKDSSSNDSQVRVEFAVVQRRCSMYVFWLTLMLGDVLCCGWVECELVSGRLVAKRSASWSHSTTMYAKPSRRRRRRWR